MNRLVVVLPALLFSGFLQAEEVRCESINNGRAECRIDTSGEVRMIQRLSDSGCDEGRSWGVERGYVWVDRGCRAIFGTFYDNHSNSGGGVPSSLPNRVTCESVNNRRTECDMDTRGEVRLARKLSDASCTEGTSWGLFKHSVWVDHGCRAIFESAGTGPAYDNDPEYGGSSDTNTGGVPNRLVAACNAVEDRYGKVESSSPLKPGAWEVILRYDDGKYVCNVEGDGRVTYFEKLRNQ